MLTLVAIYEVNKRTSEAEGEESTEFRALNCREDEAQKYREKEAQN